MKPQRTISSLLLISFIIFTFIMLGCVSQEEVGPDKITDMEALKIPEGFSYETSSVIELDFKMPSSIEYGDYKGRLNVFTGEEGQLLSSGSFDQEGRFEQKIKVPATVTELLISTLAGDTLIQIAEGMNQSIAVDLTNYYTALSADSLESMGISTDGSRIGSVSSGRTAGNLPLQNGDFSVNDFGTTSILLPHTPDDPRFYITEGGEYEPLSWFNEGGEQFVGTTLTQSSRFSICQTIDVEPGDMLTFDADVWGDRRGHAGFSMWIFARNVNRGLAKHILKIFGPWPQNQWNTHSIALSLPDDAVSCQIMIMGSEWKTDKRVLFDNFRVSGILNADADGDGVEDDEDDFPNDPDKAFSVYYPNESNYGTMAFEDTWPGMGDYDFNDLVVDYQYRQIFNSDNEMTSMDAEFVFRAAGASQHNGFGFQIDLPADAIESVTGNSLEAGYIDTSPNGTEAGQEKATFIVTDNVFDVLKPPSGRGVNVVETDPYVEPVAVTLSIDFVDPVSTEEVGYAPYNPFVIINQERGRELHLPGYAPTSLVDTDYFGTGDDGTDPDSYKYYMTYSNLPWGINLPQSFEYPKEGVQILDTYTHYAQWAQSGGFSFMDWYNDRPGYIKEGKTFKKN